MHLQLENQAQSTHPQPCYKLDSGHDVDPELKQQSTNLIHLFDSHHFDLSGIGKIFQKDAQVDVQQLKYHP